MYLSNPVGKIAEKAVCGSILSAKLTKNALLQTVLRYIKKYKFIFINSNMCIKKVIFLGSIIFHPEHNHVNLCSLKNHKIMKKH